MNINTVELTPEEAKAILADERLILASRQEVEEGQAAIAEAAGLREALEIVLRSAYPHPVEHPTMTAAWKVGNAALTTPNPAALERLIREAKAEVWDSLAAEAAENESDSGYGFVEHSGEFCRHKAAELRAGKE